MRVLAVSGSLRRDSHNRRLLAAAAQRLAADVEFTVWDGLGDVPPYNEDLDVEVAPGAVAQLRAALTRADAILIATPEYNHSLPGQLKNALDWASRPFPANSLRGKPVAVVGASTSMFGAVWAQAELRRVLQAAGAHVVDEELAVPSAHEAFDDGGELRDTAQREALAVIMGQLLEAAAAPLQRVA